MFLTVKNAQNHCNYNSSDLSDFRIFVLKKSLSFFLKGVIVIKKPL